MSEHHDPTSRPLGFEGWPVAAVHRRARHRPPQSAPGATAERQGDGCLTASFILAHGVAVGLIVTGGFRGPTWLAVVGGAVFVGWWLGAIGSAP